MWNSDIDALFPGLDKPGMITPFMHHGEWAVHDVLPLLVDKMGLCDIRIATYTVSDESLRTLSLMNDVRSLHILVDMTLQRHKLPILLFAQNITNEIRLDSCHAKVLLMESDTHRFGIVGSANLNHAHRWESGFFFTAGPHYDYFSTQYDDAYANAIPIG